MKTFAQGSQLIRVGSFLFTALLISLTDASAEDVELEKIVVTASRIAQYDYNVSSDISVIDQTDILRSNAKTISELLQNQLGVNIFDNSTYKTATIDIRGFGDTANQNVLVLVNDRKVNSIDISGPDLLQIPVESVERIEIIRGGKSVLYGDNAVGGVINIITKKGKGDFSGRVGAAYGSYQTQKEDLELQGKFNDLSYYFYTRNFDTAGYRVNSELMAKDFNSRLEYTLPEKLTVGLITGWHEDDYGLPGGLSNNPNNNELEKYGRRGSANPNDFAASKDRHIQLTADFDPWPQDLDWGRLGLDVSYRNRDTYAFFDSFGGFATKRNIDRWGLGGKYSFNKNLFGRETRFITGVDFYNTQNDILGSAGNSDDLTISVEEIGYYLFGEQEVIENWFWDAGFRHHRARYEFDQRSGTPQFTKQTPDETVWLVGTKYRYGKGSNVFANTQTTFRFLATDEWYDTFNGLNTDLRQQQGIQYEAGLKHNFNGRMTVSVTGYIMDIENEIFFDPSAGSFGFGANSNYDETRRIGLEIGQTMDVKKFWDTALFERIEFFTFYTLQDAEFHGGPNDGKDIPLTPNNQLNLGLNVDFLEGFRLSISGRYIGSRWAINDTLNETAKLKPYYVVDTKLSYRWKDWDVFIAVNNIFNQQYFMYVSKSASSDIKDFFPAPERNASVGINLKF